MGINNLKFCVLFCFIFLSYRVGYTQDLKVVDTISNTIITTIYTDISDQTKNDSIQKKKASFNAYPYVFYTPESEFAGGAGGIYVFYTEKGNTIKPSKIGFGGYYSSNKQYKFSVNNSFYFSENKIVVKFPISYGYFINKFWGVGDEVPDYDNAAYTMTAFTATLNFQVPPLLFSSDRSGIIIDYDHTKIVDKLNNEFLLDEDIVGIDGGNSIGIGTDLVWDSRDHLFFPKSGGYQYFSTIFYTGLGDFTFVEFELDVRHYFPIRKDHVLAANFFLQSTTGDTPFYKLPSLGGMQMRGFFNGRYRDNFYAMTQLEYRQFFADRWGFVVFGTLGNVSEDILNYDFGNLKYSLGTGIRFLFNKKERINLRADIGVGKDGNTGIYFGIEEAF